MARLNPEAPEFNPQSLVTFTYQNPTFSFPSCYFPNFPFVETGSPPSLFSIHHSFLSVYEDLPEWGPHPKIQFQNLSWDTCTLLPAQEQQPFAPPLTAVRVPLTVEEEEEEEAREKAEDMAPRRAEELLSRAVPKMIRARRHHKHRVGGNPLSEEGKGKQVWKPKLTDGESWSSQKEQIQPQSIEFSDGRTTVMIRNIPNKFTEMLLEFLDKHCLDENEKLSSEEADHTTEFSAYDFVYLPFDFGSGCNLGYAFVNLTCAQAACRLYRALHRYKWGVLGSKKICEITYARIQGKEALFEHFVVSNFICHKDEFLPISFDPYRDGSCSFLASTVGNRVDPSDSVQKVETSP